LVDEPRIFLIPAPDMDDRAAANISIPGFRVVVVDLPVVDADSTLGETARQISARIDDPLPTLLTFCAGSIFAIEIARTRPVRTVILVSGIRSRLDIEWKRRVLGRLFLLTPTIALRWLGEFVGASGRMVLPASKRIPRIWLKIAQNKFIVREALRLAPPSSHVAALRIHGTNDRILPANDAVDRFVSGGGHFMFVSHRKRVLQAIATVLQVPSRP